MQSRVVIRSTLQDLYQVRNRIPKKKLDKFDKLYKRAMQDESLDDGETDFIMELADTHL